MKCLLLVLGLLVWLAVSPRTACAQKPADLLEKKTAEVLRLIRARG